VRNNPLAKDGETENDAGNNLPFMTVSGFTIAITFRAVGDDRDSPAKIKRSMTLNVCLLGECRLSMLI
jgi:hypothetical protein